MIPQQHIMAWGDFVPWPEPRQIEQDLLISRALVEIFLDEALRAELRFRGGTALHKLHLPAPSRYSEDIDLVRTTAGPIGPILDRLRAVLEPWLGRASFHRSKIAPKFLFRVGAEDGGSAPIRLKIEINTRETEAFDGQVALPLKVINPWFSGVADIPTYSREEMLATKLRALLQRNKGRDLYDLAYALEILEELDLDRIVTVFGHYIESSGQGLTRAQAEERMLIKLVQPQFLIDLKPLLSAEHAEAVNEEYVAEAFRLVFTSLVERIPGEPWARAQTVKESLGIAW